MIRFGGIASGLDTQNIIKELMNAERMPMNRVFQKREWTVWQRDAYREVNLAVSKFRDNFEKLRMQATFNALTANSSNSSTVQANALGTAIPGTYTLKVEEMPEAAQIISNKIDSAKSTDKVLAELGLDENETININGIDITITEDHTFDSLAKEISSKTGLRAIFDNATSTFLFATKEMGTEAQIDISGPDNVMSKLFDAPDGITKTGVDGLIYFNGQEIKDIKSNKITLYNIELTLHQKGEATIIVGSDPDQVFDTIKGFVEAYNELIADLQARTDERRNRDYLPLTTEERNALSEKEAELWDENAKKGLLASDPIIRSLLSEMRQFISTPVEGISGGKMSLAQIGIATTSDWRAGGKLAIDEDKLRAAISNNPDEVMQLFTKRADDEDGDKKTMGIGDRLFGLDGPINSAIKSLRDKAGSPGNNSDTQSVLAKSLKEVNDQLANWERRLADIEDRYWRQFTAMEKALQQMNDQSAWMMANMFGGSGGQ